jgi:hypothetical protein
MHVGDMAALLNKKNGSKGYRGRNTANGKQGSKENWTESRLQKRNLNGERIGKKGLRQVTKE